MLKDFVDEESLKLKKVCVESSAEQRLKPELKKYLTLNRESANQRLLISDDKRGAKTWEKVEDRVLRASHDTNCVQPQTHVLPNEEKPCKCSQVFCEQELRGPCYWEVEWSGTVGIGVSYKGASTTKIMGRDGKSWCVFCTDEPKNREAFEGKGERNESVRSDGVVRTHRRKVWFSSKGTKKVAVLLNWEDGKVIYYDVTAGALNLSEPIHTFHATFEESLVPGFWFQHGSVRLCETA